VVERDDHGVGLVPVVQFANRQRVSDRAGRSEITPAVMSITDAACRTLLGMEVSREFFAAPQRYILGASEGAFEDQEGNLVGARAAAGGGRGGVRGSTEPGGRFGGAAPVDPPPVVVARPGGARPPRVGWGPPRGFSGGAPGYRLGGRGGPFGGRGG